MDHIYGSFFRQQKSHSNPPSPWHTSPIMHAPDTRSSLTLLTMFWSTRFWYFCSNKELKMFWWKHGECRWDYLNPGSRTTTEKALNRNTNSDSKSNQLPTKGYRLFFFSPQVQNRIMSNIFIFTPLLTTPQVLEGLLGRKFAELLRSLGVWTTSSLSTHHLWRLSCNHHFALVMERAIPLYYE